MAEKIGEGAENEELTEFEIRKNEKEKEVVKLREDYKAIKEKEETVGGKLEEVKSAMQGRCSVLSCVFHGIDLNFLKISISVFIWLKSSFE